MEENTPINDFPWKKNQIYTFKACKRSKVFKNPKFSWKFRKLPMSITSELNMLETWNLCQNVYFWILHGILLTTQFRPKVDLGPFGNELFIWWLLTFLKISMTSPHLKSVIWIPWLFQVFQDRMNPNWRKYCHLAHWYLNHSLLMAMQRWKINKTPT